MDKALKKRWVEALRSGKYDQGIGCLRTPRGAFCCLGVLADILDPSGWRKGKYGNPGEPVHPLAADNGHLSEGAGLSVRTQLSLIKKNDGEWNFAQIADYIEKRIKGS